MTRMFKFYDYQNSVIFVNITLTMMNIQNFSSTRLAD